MQVKATVHVYANGRRFVVVPVVHDAAGDPIETQDMQTVPLTLGRPTVVRLGRALRAAREQSLRGASDRPRWDGEEGRWWSHHLLGLAIRWEDDRALLSDLGDSSPEPVLLPTGATDSQVAEHLIELLGKRLHTA